MPLAPPTAARENEAFTGYDLKNEPTMLQIPTAIISWVASTTFPGAEIIISSLIIIQKTRSYLPKAFAIPILATIDINGIKRIPVFSSDIMSPKVMVLLSFSIEKAGGDISGNPPGTVPAQKRLQLSY